MISQSLGLEMREGSIGMSKTAVAFQNGQDEVPTNEYPVIGKFVWFSGSFDSASRRSDPRNHGRALK